MARCEEEFNPWPAFVDIFSSVILVLLLFLLVTIVSIGYYAQFKFKVSYTGTITTDEIILDNDTKKLEVLEEKKEQNQDDTVQQQNMSQAVQTNQFVLVEKEENNVTMQDKIVIAPNEKVQKDTPYDLEDPGMDYAEQFNDNLPTEQQVIEEEDTFILTFKENEIFPDDVNIVKLKNFINSMKEKYPQNIVDITAVDPQKQVSATIAKQTSLGRTLSVRNLIRKFGYQKNDVRIDLNNNEENSRGNIETDYGHIIVTVKKK